MTSYLVGRILWLVPMLVIVSLVVFLVINLLPGDPAVLIAGDQATEETLQRIRSDLNLDRPLMVRYFDWLGSMVRGDFGESLRTRQGVRPMLANALPITFQLTLLATLFMIPVGVVLGTAAAAFRGSVIDVVATVIGTVGIAVPNFWLALLMVHLFALTLGVLPSAGFTAMWDDPVEGFRYSVLPSLALAAPGIAVLTRQTRSSIVDVLTQDYVRTAKAKGLRGPTVMLRHALRNAVIPVMSVIGIQIALLIGGSVIIETVFSIPGMGRLIVDSIFFRDYPVVQSVSLVMVTLVLVLNISVDLSYAFIDPRIRLSGGSQ